MPRAISPVLHSGLIGYKRYLAWAAVFSCVINLLTLSIPLYTIQVYATACFRAGSGATLMVLTVAVVGGMAAAAMLEDIRARLLVALGINFDLQLAAQLFERQIEAHAAPGGAQTISRSRHRPPRSDGRRHSSLFDLPWTPLFIAACFYLHPVLGVVTLFGVLSGAGARALEPVRRVRPLAQSAKATEQSYRLTEGAIGNAETVRAMGMLPELSRRWTELRSEAINRQADASARATPASRASSSSCAMFFRSPSWRPAPGLAVSREITPGSLFAASLICTRAMLPDRPDRGRAEAAPFGYGRARPGRGVTGDAARSQVHEASAARGPDRRRGSDLHASRRQHADAL